MDSRKHTEVHKTAPQTDRPLISDFPIVQISQLRHTPTGAGYSQTVTRIRPKQPVPDDITVTSSNEHMDHALLVAKPLQQAQRRDMQSNGNSKPES